jgi:hypothetical protein
MNRRLDYGLAAVATTLTLYYAIPLGLAIISLGEICAYSPAGTGLCTQSTAAPTSSIPSAATTSPEPKPGKLCNQPGIRYAGKTAEGAEVCFTLTPDGSKWVEIGFNFVRASACPDSTTTGRTHYEGQEPLAGPGRLTAPGFRATIRGSRASGELEDSDVCPGKRFKWSAGRVPSS